jgi:hypothetical protein
VIQDPSAAGRRLRAYDRRRNQQEAREAVPGTLKAARDFGLRPKGRISEKRDVRRKITMES